MLLRDFVLLVLVMLAWGFNFTVGKIGVELIPPLFLIGLRFVLVGFLVFVAPIPRLHLKKLFLLSLTLGIAHFGPMFIGLRLIDSGTAAIIAQLQVPFATLLAIFFLGDRPGWRRISGMVLAFGGVTVLSGEPRLLDNILGGGLVVLATFVWALANLQMKKLPRLSSMAINGWVCLFAAPQLFVGSALLEQNQIPSLIDAGWRGAAVLAYLVFVATILAYSLWYDLIRRYDISIVMPLTLMSPLFSVLSGMLVLDEPLTWQMVVGGSLILAGVGVIVIRRPHQVPPPGTS